MFAYSVNLASDPRGNNLCCKQSIVLESQTALDPLLAIHNLSSFDEQTVCNVSPLRKVIFAYKFAIVYKQTNKQTMKPICLGCGVFALEKNETKSIIALGV